MQHATKCDLKGGISIDACNLALKSDLASQKCEIDELDIDKQKTDRFDLVDKLVAKLCANLSKMNTVEIQIPTSGLVSKTRYVFKK